MKPNAEKEFDLLVVGAGIYGAWMAYDATLRGLKVLIIDKGDIANGTSSASSKLIHGGLRYLEHLNFSLVKKSVKERQTLLKIAPHRVSPLKFGVPVYKSSRIASWKYKVGLTVYDWFANLKNKAFKHESLSSEEFINRYPGLRKSNLKKGFTYLDAATDDFRYTLEIIDGAVKAGAELKTYCELIEYNNNEALIKDAFSKEESKVNFKAAVNATGQWTDELFETKLCRLSKGIHIILPGDKRKDALLLLSPIDQRVFFAIPWYGKTMIGTTDTDYTESPNSVSVNQQDIDYLLNSYNHYLNEPFKEDQIISSFAGLRVLKNTEGHPSSVTRDWEWRKQEDNIFISLGGKLTSSREDSSRLIDKICQKLNFSSECKTSKIMFPWAHEDFEKWKHKTILSGKKLELKTHQMELLISRQGKRTIEILELISEDKSLSEAVLKKLPFTKGELYYILKNEYVRTLEDLVRRRIPLTLLKSVSKKELETLRSLSNDMLRKLNKDELKG